MSVLDIKKGYRHISPEELRSYAYSGHVYYGSADLSDFLEYIFQGMHSQEELDKAVEEAETADTTYCAECGEMM
jgi:hypothetical protein